MRLLGEDPGRDMTERRWLRGVEGEMLLLVLSRAVDGYICRDVPSSAKARALPTADIGIPGHGGP